MMRGLWLDKRIGGRPRWYFGDHTELMRVPDSLRECVFFITAVWGSRSCLSTGFFVGVEIPSFPGKAHNYAVTARHNIWDPENGLADRIIVRMNSPQGAICEADTNPDEWLRHPSADVAVLPRLDMDASIFKYRVWDVRSAATQDFIRSRKIGPGDEVFLTGQLVYNPGVTRMMPVVRIGAISALPDDPVNLKYTGPDVVALVEARSLMGFSGSPVFLHLPFWRDTEEGLFVSQAAEAASGGERYLLGVMHGYYPVEENDPYGMGFRDDDPHTGISVVVLVDRILDLVDSPDERRERQVEDEKLEKAQTPKPARAQSEKPEEFEQFEDATRKLIQVPKKEIDEKRKDES